VEDTLDELVPTHAAIS